MLIKRNVYFSQTDENGEKKEKFGTNRKIAALTGTGLIANGAYNIKKVEDVKNLGKKKALRAQELFNKDLARIEKSTPGIGILSDFERFNKRNLAQDKLNRKLEGTVSGAKKMINKANKQHNKIAAGIALTGAGAMVGNHLYKKHKENK